MVFIVWIELHRRNCAGRRDTLDYADFRIPNSIEAVEAFM